MTDKQTVWVSGGAGHVGSVLVPHLLQEGYKVRVLDHFRRHSNGLFAHVGNDDLEIVRGDCRDMDVIAKTIQGCEWLIPLAAIVGAPACDVDVDAAFNTNEVAICHLLNLRKEDQKVLFPTTNSGYGRTPPGELTTEDSPLNPISTYGQTKELAEKDVLSRPNTLSFRFATACGASPRMRLDLLVNDFVHRAVRDKSIVLYEPEFRRNFIHVRDMARVFVHGMKNFEKMKGKCYNAGMPYSLNKRQLCEYLKKDFCPDLQVFESEIGNDPDKRDYTISNKRLEDTGFYMKYGLTSAIEEVIEICKMLPEGEFSNI